MSSVIDLESMFHTSIVVAPTNATDGCCLKIRSVEYDDNSNRVVKYKKAWLTQSEIKGLIIALATFVED